MIGDEGRIAIFKKQTKPFGKEEFVQRQFWNAIWYFFCNRKIRLDKEKQTKKKKEKEKGEEVWIVKSRDVIYSR